MENCPIGRTETEWFGIQLSRSGIKPVESKIQAKFEEFKPKILSFMGANNRMNRFMPNLANLSAPLRPMLKKHKPWDWTEPQKQAF